MFVLGFATIFPQNVKSMDESNNGNYNRQTEKETKKWKKKYTHKQPILFNVD